MNGKHDFQDHEQTKVECLGIRYMQVPLLPIKTHRRTFFPVHFLCINFSPPFSLYFFLSLLFFYPCCFFCPPPRFERANSVCPHSSFGLDATCTATNPRSINPTSRTNNFSPQLIAPQPSSGHRCYQPAHHNHSRYSGFRHTGDTAACSRHQGDPTSLPQATINDLLSLFFFFFWLLIFIYLFLFFLGGLLHDDGLRPARLRPAYSVQPVVATWLTDTHTHTQE